MAKAVPSAGVEELDNLYEQWLPLFVDGITAYRGCSPEAASRMADDILTRRESKWETLTKLLNDLAEGRNGNPLGLMGLPAGAIHLPSRRNAKGASRIPSDRRKPNGTSTGKLGQWTSREMHVHGHSLSHQASEGSPQSLASCLVNHYSQAIDVSD